MSLATSSTRELSLKNLNVDIMAWLYHPSGKIAVYVKDPVEEIPATESKPVVKRKSSKK